ncbi:MAG: isoprenyl transferase [Clostridia bacterium]
MQQKTDISNLIIPNHIAFIMDGNGRWAKKIAMPRKVGHIAGAKTFKKIVDYCEKIGVKYVTAYAFSTENWKRPKDEVDSIMKLLVDYLNDAIKNFKNDNRILRFIGDREPLSDLVKQKMQEAEDSCKGRTGMIVTIAINYGSRDEICNATKNIVKMCLDGKLSIDDIDNDLISKNLYTADIPDPDLIIRPSGEIRLSNFLMWQAAYSEFWFDNVLWPDFSQNDLNRAIKDYNTRDRRFGGI